MELAAHVVDVEAEFARREAHLGKIANICGILVESDFLTLLSPQQVALEVESGVLAAIGPEPAISGRVIGVTTRRDWRPTRAQARFLAALEQAAGLA